MYSSHNQFHSLYLQHLYIHQRFAVFFINTKNVKNSIKKSKKQNKSQAQSYKLTSKTGTVDKPKLGCWLVDQGKGKPHSSVDHYVVIYTEPVTTKLDPIGTYMNASTTIATKVQDEIHTLIYSPKHTPQNLPLQL